MPELDDLIFDGFADSKNYDKIRHKFDKAGKSMALYYAPFKRLNAAQRFSLLSAVIIIVTDSQNQSLDSARVLSSPSKNTEKDFPNSVDRGYKPPKVIPLDRQKLLG